MSKYKNKKTKIDGIVFDSKVEGQYYLKLKDDREKGIVLHFDLQPVYELQPKFEKDGKKHRAIKIKADFRVIYAGQKKTEVVDIKGHPSEGAKLKRKMFDYMFEEKLIWLCFSKIDGGWIEYDQLIKNRKQRKKEKNARNK